MKIVKELKSFREIAQNGYLTIDSGQLPDDFSKPLLSSRVYLSGDIINCVPPNYNSLPYDTFLISGHFNKINQTFTKIQSSFSIILIFLILLIATPSILLINKDLIRNLILGLSDVGLISLLVIFRKKVIGWAISLTLKLNKTNK